MISTKRLIQMARKWVRAAAAGRKRIAFRVNLRNSASTPTSRSVPTPAPAAPRKGHFVVYSCDGQRFEVSLAFLESDLFVELLRISQDLLGLASDGPITLPWDAASVGSVVSCLRGSSRRDSERAEELLASMAACCSCPASSSSLLNRPLVACEC